MNARNYPEEVAEGWIAELIPVHTATIRQAIESGDVALIADGVTDLLCDNQLAGQLVRLSVVAPHAAGYVLGFLTEMIIAQQAEIEATKAVDRAEVRRRESEADALIERGVCAAG